MLPIRAWNRLGITAFPQNDIKKASLYMMLFLFETSDLV